MAGLMEELITVLQNECSEYEQLIELSNEKTPIIIQGDIIRLQEVTEREQDVTSNIQNLEIKREKIADDIAVVLSREKSELKLDNLIKILQKQPKEQEKIRQVQKRLKKVLSEMAEVNEKNGMLIRQSIEMVEFDLVLFKSMRQAPETANYDKNAYNTGTLLGGGGFDTKQ